MFLLLSRIQDSPLYDSNICSEAPYGRFAGRPIIADSTSVNGGIYLSVEPREALVVDEKYGALSKFYDDFILEYARTFGSKVIDDLGLFEFAASCTDKAIRLSERDALQILDSLKIQPDEKVSMDVFLGRKVGGARHRIILLAYLIEKMRIRGLLAGEYFIRTIESDAGELSEELIYKSLSEEVLVYRPVTGDSFN